MSKDMVVPSPANVDEIIRKAKGQSEGGHPSLGNPLSRMVSAKTLMDKQYPPMIELVPGMIVSGTVILAAAPKIGKSWLVLGLALASANGDFAFGSVKVEPRPVLYLALEDGERRLQQRLLSLGVVDPPENLFFITDPSEDVPTVIDAFMEEHQSEQPLIILDTLGKVLPTIPAGRNESSYERDYRIMSALKALVDKHYGSTLLIVHHARKMGATDAVETISGTNGIAGAADAIMTLQRPRTSSEGTLFVTSRDAEEGEYQMAFASNGSWTLTGGSVDAAKRAFERGKRSENLDTRSQLILDCVEQHLGGITPKEVTEITGVDRSIVDTYLKRLLDSQRIRKVKRGVYAPLTDEPELTEAEV